MKPCWKPTIMEKVRYILIFLYPNLCSSLRWSSLPEVRVITRYQGLNVYDRDYNDLIERLNRYQKRMIIVGQMNLIYLFEKRHTKLLYKHFVWLTEHIGNQTVPGIPVKNFDAGAFMRCPKRKPAR